MRWGRRMPHHLVPDTFWHDDDSASSRRASRAKAAVDWDCAPCKFRVPHQRQQSDERRPHEHAPLKALASADLLARHRDSRRCCFFSLVSLLGLGLILYYSFSYFFFSPVSVAFNSHSLSFSFFVSFLSFFLSSVIIFFFFSRKNTASKKPLGEGAFSADSRELLKPAEANSKHPPQVKIKIQQPEAPKFGRYRCLETGVHFHVLFYISASPFSASSYFTLYFKKYFSLVYK